MNRYAQDQAIAFLRSWLEYQSRQLHIPGFVVAIQHKTKLLMLEAYGKANVEKDEALRTDHLFGVASISKMFTATAVMQLVEKGAIALEDHAVAHLPWLAAHPDKRFREITIEHLLRHGAGLLRDGRNSDFWQLQRPFPDETELRNEVLSAELVERPGGKLKYSNIGYALLGQIIQSVSGLTYSQYVTKYIIEPLGLHRTAPDYRPDWKYLIATGYTRPFDRHRLPVPKEINTKAFSPLFGWHTTAQDLCTFMAAHFLGKDVPFLSKDSLTALHKNNRHHWVPPQERGSEYSFGFTTYQFGERQVTGHGGVFIGHRSCAYADEANQLVVVILSNARDAPTLDMLRGILQVFDYFETWGSAPLPTDRKRFNTRLMGFWGTLQIVATAQRIVTILPEQLSPFEDPDELEIVDAHTLKIVQTHDFASAGEKIHLTYKGDEVISANYAGTTLLSERAYWKKLKKGFV